MELSSLLGDDRFTDHPQCVCPAIAAFLRGYNDVVDDDLRSDLVAIAAAVVGSRSTDASQREARVEALTEWAVEAWSRGRVRMPWQPLFPPQNGFIQLEQVGHYVGRRANRDHGLHELTLRMVERLVSPSPPPALATSPPVHRSPPVLAAPTQT